MLPCPLQPNSSSVLHRVCTIYLSGRKIEEKERDKEREDQKEYARERERVRRDYAPALQKLRKEYNATL